MSKILNILMIFLIIIFLIVIFKYYSSNKNIKIKNYNRSNIDQILKERISDLPILANDTDDVIQFNDLFGDEINKSKKRSFWDLLKK